MADKVDKYLRQSTILDQAKLKDQNALIVGVGAVGKQVGHLLAAIGVPKVTICDFDDIEEHNCTTQLWRHADIGKKKAEVCAGEMAAINPDIEVTHHNERWRPKLFKDKDPITVLFNCVDSMDMRLKLFKYYDAKLEDFAMFDARIGGEQLEFYSTYDKDTRKGYPDTIIDDKDAYEEQGCHGVPMISHSAVVGAAFIVQQFVAYVQGKPLYPKRGLVFGSSELYDL